ncbi:MAG: hypothetical protein EXS00_05940 [Phycisphaerales bacterium]|nr:hypothetical protein [Phycisphaerales bacterium]
MNSSSVNDPFSVLGMRRSFAISMTELRQSMLRQAVALHPDRFPEPVQREAAERQMAMVTAASTELGDPERRARALMRLAVGESGQPEPKMDQAFLMEMLELRDAGDSSPVREMQQGIVAQIAAFFEECPNALTAPASTPIERPSADARLGGPAQTPDWAYLRALLSKHRYLTRLLAQLEGRPDRG